MITNRIFFFITLLSIIIISYSCKQKTDFETELTEFDKGLVFIEKQFNKERLNNFKNARGITEQSIKENEGNVFINEYLNSPKGQKLIDFFISKEVSDKKDIRDIMLTSLFRKLNSDHINLDEQIDARVVPRKQIEVCENKQKIKAQNYYTSFYIGDTITVIYPVNEKFQNAGYPPECPTIDWTFKEGKDLKLKSVIVDKYHWIDSMRQPVRYYFKMRVLEISNWKMPVLGNRVEKNDILELDLNNAIIDSVW